MNVRNINADRHGSGVVGGDSPDNYHRLSRANFFEVGVAFERLAPKR